MVVIDCEVQSVFASLIPKINPWFVVSDAYKKNKKRKLWYQRARYVLFFYLNNKLDNGLLDNCLILTVNSLPAVLDLKD